MVCRVASFLLSELVLNFEPFAVQCTTCGSRLRVTDSSLIGQITTCPKCNSMIQIEIPHSGNNGPQLNQQVAVGSSNVDSQAITEDSIAPAEITDPTDAPSGFAGSDTVPSSQLEDSLGSSIDGPAPPNWESAKTQRSRQVGLVFTIATSGLLGAGLLFGWFIKNWNSTPPAIASVDAEDQGLNQEQLPAVADSVADIEPNDVPTESGDAVDSDSMPSARPRDTEPDDLPSVDTEPQTPDQDSDSQKDLPSVASTPMNTEVPNDLLPADLNDPFGLGVPKSDDDAKEDAQPTGPADLPEEMKSVIGILDLDGDQAAPALEKPPTIDEIEIEMATDENVDPTLIANPPKPINFKRALSTEMGLLSEKGYSLADLALVFSQTSGVPIQIDWVSFELVGFDIAEPVQGLKAMGTLPMTELLDRIASTVGGKVVRGESMLTIAPSDEAIDQSVRSIVDLSDFGAGQATATITINQFLGGKASEKEVALGSETMDKQLAALATDALRRVRGIAPKIDHSRFRRWAQSVSDPRLDWPIVSGGDPGPQFRSPLAFAGLARRIAQKNDSLCFINWFDANRRGLSPKQLVMPNMAADAGQVMRSMLDSFELQARQVDKDHWWIGTESSYDRFPVVVWTSQLGAQSDAFAARLQTACAQASFEMKMSVDPETGCAILLLPRFVVRQLPKLQNGLKLTQTN